MGGGAAFERQRAAGEEREGRFRSSRVSGFGGEERNPCGGTVSFPSVLPPGRAERNRTWSGALGAAHLRPSLAERKRDEAMPPPGARPTPHQPALTSAPSATSPPARHPPAATPTPIPSAP